MEEEIEIQDLNVLTCMLCLVIKINLDYLMWEKTAAGGIAWNSVDRIMTETDRAFTNASMCRVKTGTNIEQ